jgi:hypothetical protein
LSRDPQAKSKAVQALIALPDDKRNTSVVALLAALGANHEALA